MSRLKSLSKRFIFPKLLARAVVILGSIVALYWGWSLFWFLTDDAFIAFRYVSNSLLGYGLVWNPPPFRPVEGYTSFAWVILLKYVWVVTGVAPPESSNWLSLGFGYATLFLGYRMLLRVTLPIRLEPHRWGLLALAVLGTVSNRTFLTWLSSGLETAMFNFALTWWVYMGLISPAARRPWWILSLCSSCTLIALTRPDGLLYFFAGAMILLHAVWTRRYGSGLRPLLGSLVMLAVPCHVLFRRFFYGEWVPNTYFAKVVGAWPEIGILYALSFIIEYGIWVWAILAALFLYRTCIRGWKQNNIHRLWPRLNVALVVGSLVAHASYYILIVGGDHFEYRVLSQLVLLLFISAVWMAGQCTTRPSVAYAWVGAFVLMSWPIPWLHWHVTNDLNTQQETAALHTPIAPKTPVLLRPPVAAWDHMQKDLISHFVCTRHQTHKVFCQSQLKNWPTREQGSQITWEDHRAIIANGAVGVLSWVLPEVAIIDVLGLNDRVIARNPKLWPGPRRMAHSRKPPAGYVECFDPNVIVEIAEASQVEDERWLIGISVRQRQQPLTDERIRWCEDRKWY